jgi:hypothetical protein
MKNNEFELEKQLIILSVPTIKKLLSFKKRGVDAITLYIFYYYTAKWQKTNQPKATANYCMEGLGWGEKRFKSADKILRDLGLIEKITNKDKNNKITGWYVRLNYIWTSNKERELDVSPGVPVSPEVPEPEGSISTRVEKPPGGSQETNALSVSNLNALSVNKEMLTVANATEPFSFESKLNQLISSKDKKLQIIGLYWKFTGIAFPSYEAYQAGLRRELRPAKNLIGYPLEQIISIFDYLDFIEKNEGWLEKWTLETVHKFIDRVNWIPRDSTLVETLQRSLEIN